MNENDMVIFSALVQYIVYAGNHPRMPGYQITLRFPNNYGASVILTPYSYGGKSGEFELAVLKWSDGNKYELDYTTPITDDVLGNLSAQDVRDTLSQIMALPFV